MKCFARGLGMKWDAIYPIYAIQGVLKQKEMMSVDTVLVFAMPGASIMKFYARARRIAMAACQKKCVAQKPKTTTGFIVQTILHLMTVL